MSAAQLRDLARKIEALAREHPAFSAARNPVANLCDHLQAMAGYSEQLQRRAKLEILHQREEMAALGRDR